MAEFSSAFEQIMGDTAVDDLSGYTVETFGRSARAASLGNISLDATEVVRTFFKHLIQKSHQLL
jgi:hypothetical protein